MPTMQAVINNLPTQSLADGTTVNALAGKQGDLIVSDLHGKYFTQTYRGNMFIGSTAVGGVVPPIYNNTAQTFAIWNPYGSGKLLVPIKLCVGLVTVGVVTSNWCWGYRTDAGSQIATGSSITAFTSVAPVNANLGSKNASVANFAPAACTVTAPSYLRTVGISNLMASTPQAQNNFWNLTEYYDGEFIIAPGTVAFVANNIAGVATYNISVLWYEIPV